MAGKIEEIQFIDLETDAPLVTVKGDNAQVLLKESELLQTIINEIGGQANPRVLVVPIGKMPTDRQIIFANILRGVPVGKKDQWGEIFDMYPLGEKEERNIKRAVNATGVNSENDKHYYTNQERINILFEIMQYLLIPKDIIQNMLKFDVEDTRPERSIEDDIEQLLDTHKKYLYLLGQDQKLTPEDFEEAKAFFNEIRANYQKEMRELEDAWARHQTRRRGYAYNSNNNRGRNATEEYEEAMDPFTYAPVHDHLTANMPMREYERWLRTVYFKKAPLELNNLHVNVLFNENRRANRNRRNRGKVVYVNNNKNGTRKTNGKNGRNNKKAKKAAGAGNNGGRA